MSSEHRVKRLRELIAQLERLPASAERDRMLREVRGRLVDVDTGVAPSAPLPVYPEEAMRAVTSAPATPPAAPAEPPQPVEAAPSELPDDERDALTFMADVVLSLYDDDEPFAPEDAQPGGRPAWTRGLRG